MFKDKASKDMAAEESQEGDHKKKSGQSRRILIACFLAFFGAVFYLFAASSLGLFPFPSTILEESAAQALVASGSDASLLLPVGTRTLSPRASEGPELRGRAVHFRILYQSVNIHSGPGIMYDVTAVLERNDVVKVVARTADNGWYNIEMADDQTAWISSSVGRLEKFSGIVYIPIIVDLVSTPGIDPTPLPTATPVTPTPTPTPTVAPYGAAFTWNDPFQNAEQQRQLANFKALEPTATWASLLLLVVWLFWGVRVQKDIPPRLFEKWQGLHRASKLMAEMFLALFLIMLFFGVS